MGTSLYGPAKTAVAFVYGWRFRLKGGAGGQVNPGVVPLAVRKADEMPGLPSK